MAPFRSLDRGRHTLSTVTITRELTGNRSRTRTSITANGTKALRKEVDALLKIMAQIDDSDSTRTTDSPAATKGVDESAQGLQSLRRWRFDSSLPNARGTQSRQSLARRAFPLRTYQWTTKITAENATQMDRYLGMCRARGT